jgi:hypothetical protein
MITPFVIVLYRQTYLPINKYKVNHKLHIFVLKKGKMIPLHAMEAHGVRGGVAPTHS